MNPTCCDPIRRRDATGPVLRMLAVVSVLSAASLAHGIIVTDGFDGEVETAAGFVHPAVLVGFNPQPEPPMPWDLRDPTKPMIGWSNDQDHYQILFGFDLGSEVTFDTRQAVPDADGSYVMGVEPQPFMGVDPQPFNVFFEIMATEGTFDRASWLSFNPQPEPPKFEGKTIGFEFDVTPNSPTAVTLAFSIQDPGTQNFATFRLIPEPASLGLLGATGLTVLARRRMRR